MRTRALWISLLGFVGLAGGLFGLNFGLSNTPVLGLDLKGGLSVIYATAEPADQEQLVIVRDLMRGQLESFGIAEPDVRVEGENIIVDLPGVDDQEAAFEALQVSGIVTLRPVIQCQAGVIGSDTTGTSVPSDAVTSDSTPATTTPEATTPVTTTPTSGDVVESGAPAGRPLGFANPASTPSTSTPDTTPDTTTPDSTTPDTTTPDSTTPDSTTPDTVPVATAPPIDTSGQSLLPYPGAGQTCLVGPSGGTGEVFAQGSAAATINQNSGQWVVNVDLRSDGQIVWNSLAQTCFNGAGSCPSRQLAIVLDDVIQSAPTVQTPDFPGSVQISGAFDEAEVRSLARVLNRGAFPVPVEQQRVETVSPTAGQDSLNAAVIAGLIGVAVMLAFMIAYYRKLSVVIIAGLTVWGMTVFTLATFVSEWTNYALTLAGVTGIIVAVGVTVDTYVVFFERLKDEVRHGRSLKNAAPRSFSSTWRTIVSADLVSLMASLVLFALSVGSVKGFALYLGLTTICDLLVCYFFTRPAVILLANTKWFDSDANREATVGSRLGAAS
jgi:preprotein translocase subunit SecD